MPCSTVERISTLHTLGLLRTPQSGDGEALVTCCRITSEGMDELRSDLPALLKDARRLAKSEDPKDHPKAMAKAVETFELWQEEHGDLAKPADPAREENTLIEDAPGKDDGLDDGMAGGEEFGDDLLDIPEEEEEGPLAGAVATKPKVKPKKKTTRKPSRGAGGKFK